MEKKINVEILATPGCSRCAQTKKILEKIKPDFPTLTIKETDITKHPEVVQKYQIMSTPGVVINGKLEFEGGASEQALREKLKKKEI